MFTSSLLLKKETYLTIFPHILTSSPKKSKMNSARGNEQATTICTQDQFDRRISHLGHSRIPRPSRILAPRSPPPLTKNVPHKIPPLDRRWASFPRSAIVDQEILVLQHHYTVSERQHVPSNQGTRSPRPHHNNVGDYLKSEVVRERKHNNFKAPLFKLARKIKSLIEKAKSN